MDYKQFFKNIEGKKIAVCGIGISNTPLIEKFLSLNATVYACDKRTKEQIGEVADNLEKQGAILKLGEDYLKNLEVDIIFRTPGINYYTPELVQARDNEIAVTSEMEVFFEVCPATIFAVTGSDGKTTTTTLIAEMLRKEGKNVIVGGNIGRPLLPLIEEIKPTDYVVVELSSFQLISMRKSPDVAVVTNIAPNHLDVHKDMEEYINAKKNIILHQNAFSRTVLNDDDPIMNEDFSKEVRGQFMHFSMTKPVTNGTWLGKDGNIYMSYRKMVVPIMNKSEIKVIGEHNVANYIAAISAVWGYVGADTIREVAHTFSGVEHRIEFVREKEGVRYYNDSIASSPTRTIACLKSFEQKIILIAGGYDKKISFNPLAPYVNEKVKVLILSGPTADKIEKAVMEDPSFTGQVKIIHSDSLESSVKLAKENASDGDIIALSPACASFDAFPNFMVRGKAFKDLVNSL